MKLGIKTDTQDITGKVISKKDVEINKLSDEKVTKALKKFLGKQMQVPPMYSAIKVNRQEII